MSERHRYRRLNAALIQATAERLSQRIQERFPDSGLSRVGRELCELASTTGQLIERLGRPNWWLRIGVWLSIAAALGVAVVIPLSIKIPDADLSIPDLLQGVEAAINNIVFVAIAIWFLVTVEQRPKRHAALRALHELRCIAHIIDMHQLTKDPAHQSSGAGDTASSPTRNLSRAQLGRYLDYCSEMLSLTSKLAALYAQQMDDEVVLEAVNDIETLAGGLSSKIWQKLMILDAIDGRSEAVHPQP